MLGIGAFHEETLDVLRDLRANDCDTITNGQYLPPSKHDLAVQRFVHPDELRT